MSSEPGTFERVLAEVGQALLPLRDALRSKEEFGAFMLALGWQVDDIPEPLAELGSGLGALLADLRSLLGDGGVNAGGSAAAGGSAVTAEPDLVGRVLSSVQQVVAGVRAI